MRKRSAFLFALLTFAVGNAVVGCGGKTEESQSAPATAVPNSAPANPNPPFAASPPPAAGSDGATVERANKIRDDIRNNDH